MATQCSSRTTLVGIIIWPPVKRYVNLKLVTSKEANMRVRTFKPLIVFYKTNLLRLLSSPDLKVSDQQKRADYITITLKMNAKETLLKMSIFINSLTPLSAQYFLMLIRELSLNNEVTENSWRV